MSAINLKNVTYDVPDKRILNDVSLSIEHGQIVSIMGESGSGKTTLLKMMTGLIKPTEGKILVDDTDIVPLNESDLMPIRLKMGLVFQYSALFDSLNVYDNIVFGVIRHRKRIKRAELDEIVRDRLAQVNLEDIGHQMPSELSGGMQKRVGLARALAMEPSIVFYDEPTSGLDPITTFTIDELIMETRNKMNVTSVVVSHDLTSVFHISDRIAMLHKGEIVFYGTPDEIHASNDPTVKAFIHPGGGA